MKAWLELIKIRITVASMVTTLVGYVLARGQFDLNLIPVMLGIFLQACGAAALNQVQDSHLDGKMPRTAGRPIPSGRISRAGAAWFAIGLVAAGTGILARGSMTAAWLGLLAAVVYNGVYTPLKRTTPFAALPGALIGALPPVVGWVAAGGYLNDPTIHLVAFFFFIWQIPHFWLLLLFYENDYIEGGLPSLFDRFDRRQIVKLTFLWIAAVCVAALLLPLFALLDRPLLAYLIGGAGFLVVVRSLALLKIEVLDKDGILKSDLREKFVRSCRIRFMELNTFALLVSILLVTDSVV
ncbi:MAG: protoheme IX farnesyltransferase [bacterium]|nr:protoheme IX farnesyltransferase [bacterium]